MKRIISFQDGQNSFIQNNILLRNTGVITLIQGKGIEISGLITAVNGTTSQLMLICAIVQHLRWEISTTIS